MRPVGSDWPSYGHDAQHTFHGQTTLTSLSVKETEQGSAAGAISAAQAMGMVVAPLVSTWLYHFNLALPYLFVGLMMVAWAAWLKFIG